MQTETHPDSGNGPQWGYVVDAAAVKPGRAVAVQVGDTWLAICNDAGTYFACQNLCPHAGGSLGKGEVRDGRVYCPVHHWPWDLRTGLTADEMPWMRVKRYRCEVREGKVYVDVSTLPAV